jgi:N-acetyl-anhydromuramyl-L-alanine amidase AmpD
MIKQHHLFYTILVTILSLFFISTTGTSSVAAGRMRVVDYRKCINPNFVKKERRKTNHIIVHTSEGGLESTLKTVCKGKRGISYGGHANYVIARNGTVYRILDKQYRADHAGRSVWNGIYDISSYSVGIELVGYHYDSITESQYAALRALLPELQRAYGIADRNILTHSQVAYGLPNKWVLTEHRGRKRCAMNFNRWQAGLKSGWTYDPDVTAGRVTADTMLASIFYSKKDYYARKNYSAPSTSSSASSASSSTFSLASLDNVISKTNTAWSIAGGDYDTATTCYKLPDGRMVRGSEVERVIGWDKVPTGTVVLLNQDPDSIKDSSPVRTITESHSAFMIAGSKYNDSATFYLYPDGTLHYGTEFLDWDDIPAGTKMLIDYQGPFKITDATTPFSLVRFKYNSRDIVYHVPGTDFKTGETISDFNDLPNGTCVFVPSWIKLANKG